MKLIDPATGQAVWDSNDPNAGPVPPAPEGRQWVRLDEPGDTMAPRRTAPGILDIGNGVTERLAFLNQTFNPVEGIGSAMRAGSRMVAPDQSYWDRIASLGEMASGVASIAAPMAAAKAIGVPAASAMMEGLLGFSPAGQAAGDMARQFGVDESGALRLFHGSPHNFDRFSMSKIGTGEGAQAYGQGLYFAEAEDVAKAYRDNIGTGVSYKGQPILANLQDGTMVNPIAARMSETGEDAEAAIRSLAQKYRSDAQTVLRRGQTPYPGGDPVKFAAQYNQMADEVLAMNPADFGRSGRMYEVDVNANPEDFLDWDLPLSEQPIAVQNALAPMVTSRLDALEAAGQRGRQMAAEKGLPDFTPKSRETLYGQMRVGDIIGASRLGQFEGRAEDILSEAGIPGIRYLDAGSRGAGDGSRNYVVFDENLINIVRKYGIAGAATMLGVSAFDVKQAMAENMSPSQWDQLVVGPQ